jgi:hypothetical protein
MPRDRYKIRAQKIGSSGGTLGFVDDFPPKPKGMHWKRYERLRRQHDAAEEQFLVRTAAWIYRLAGRPVPNHY